MRIPFLAIMISGAMAFGGLVNLSKVIDASDRAIENQGETDANLVRSFHENCAMYYVNLADPDGGSTEAREKTAELIRKKCSCLDDGIATSLTDDDTVPPMVKHTLRSLFYFKAYKGDKVDRELIELGRSLRSRLSPSEDEVYLTSVDAFTADVQKRAKACFALSVE